jgi:hypothetical protein
VPRSSTPTRHRAQLCTAAPPRHNAARSSSVPTDPPGETTLVSSYTHRPAGGDDPCLVLYPPTVLFLLTSPPTRRQFSPCQLFPYTNPPTALSLSTISVHQPADSSLSVNHFRTPTCRQFSSCQSFPDTDLPTALFLSTVLRSRGSPFRTCTTST